MLDGSAMADPLDDDEAPAVDTVYLNKEQMAAALSTSVPTLNKWIADGCPVHVRGSRGSDWQFDPEQVAAWREGRIEELKEQQRREAEKIREFQDSLDLGRNDNDVPHVSARARTEYYQAEKLRMELDRQRGFLVETAEVRIELARVFGVLADRLQGLPDYLERRAQLTPDQVDELANVVTEWQRELANMLMAPPDDGEEVDRVA